MRYFVVTLMLAIFVVFCAIISLAGPWYTIREQWSAPNSTVVTRESYYYLYRDISLKSTYETMGVVTSTNSSRLSWDKSQMDEFGRVFHLCGPILICATIVDFFAFFVLVIAKFSSTTKRQYAGTFVRCCFSFRRRWILLFCGLLCTANVLTLIGSLLFLSSPTAFAHDIERRDRTECTTGPCVTWSGSASSANFFRNWGPYYAWYAALTPYSQCHAIINLILLFRGSPPLRIVAIALVGIRIAPLATGLIWRYVESQKDKYARL